MKRKIYADLLAWKNDSNSKPLLLQGARQVGKTFLITEFGKNEYENFVYLNFEQDVELEKLFLGNLNPRLILENLSLYFNTIIDENTLVFFDEIQNAPRALTSLKYFQEQAPGYNIISAGSLLGVSVAKESSFPVGKVDFMTLYPMSFNEYLTACGEDLLEQKIESKIDNKPLPEILHIKLENYLKRYLFIGGMPEVVNNYITNGGINACRKIQNNILDAYSRDFSKYTDKIQAVRTQELWQSIPYQLAKENKKFKYSEARKGARASTFELTIQWLKDAGLIHIAYHIKTPKLPLVGYADRSKFKIFLLDCGLLGAMLNAQPEILVKGDHLFTEYKGAFIENFVAMELKANQDVLDNTKDLFYWTSKSLAEVDFLQQFNNEIVPIEVKSGNSRNLKSLRSYADKYKPKKIIRISPRNYYNEGDFYNYPLYSIAALKSI